jgi:hypothetical protein
MKRPRNAGMGKLGNVAMQELAVLHPAISEILPDWQAVPVDRRPSNIA